MTRPAGIGDVHRQQVEGIVVDGGVAAERVAGHLEQSSAPACRIAWKS